MILWRRGPESRERTAARQMTQAKKRKKKNRRHVAVPGEEKNKQQVRCYSDKWGNSSVCLSSPSVAACIKSTSVAVKRKTTGLPFVSV